MGIDLQQNPVARNAIHEPVGTVRDEVARPREGLAVTGDGGSVDGRRRLVGQEFEEIGCRLFKTDLHGGGIEGGDTQVHDRPLTAVHGCSPGNWIENFGVLGPRRRIHDPSKGEDEVVRCDGVTV